VFPNAPQAEGGYMYPIDRPGIGMQVDEAVLARFPVVYRPHEWTQSRLPNGAMHTP